MTAAVCLEPAQRSDSATRLPANERVRLLVEDLAEAGRIERPITPEEIDEVTITRLARAILAQATAHALGSGYLNQWSEREERRSAVAWFEEDSLAFRLICRLAGIAPSYVRGTILDRLGRR